jgi:hypothetical protein
MNRDTTTESPVMVMWQYTHRTGAKYAPPDATFMKELSIVSSRLVPAAPRMGWAQTNS